MSRAWWQRWTRRGDALTPGVDPGVSFEWPHDTDLTSEQVAIAVGDRAAAAPSPTLDAGRTVETTILNAPRLNDWQDGPTPVLGPAPSMPMRELSNDNYDRVWIAQGDHVEAMGVGDTPQEAAIEYARAVADLLRPTSGPDAFDGKAAIRAQLAACRGECGDGPPTWEEWAR